MHELIGKNKEANYDEPEKPTNWPMSDKNKGCAIEF